MRQKTDNLDRQLSYRLKKALGDDGCANWLDVRERAGMGRALWHWSQRRVLLVAGVLVLAAGACAGSVDVIPWLNRHPAAVKAPPLAPPCRAKNLYARLDFGNSLTGLSGSISLANTGRRACSLAGRPRLALIDPKVDKPRIVVEYTPPVAQPSGSIGSLRPLSLLRAVPPGRAVYIGFSWKNWCGPGPAPKALELRLPSGDRIVRRFSTAVSRATLLLRAYRVAHSIPLVAPLCYRSRWQTALQYGSFYPSWTPKSVISSYQLRSALPLRASVIRKGLPTIRKKWSGRNYGLNQLRYERGRYYTYLRVKRGAALHFRVALRNTSSRPFRFTKCPLYRETLWDLHKSALGETFVLNCSPAGVIRPGRLAFFEMELPISEDTPLGESYLSWSLSDGNRSGGVPRLIRAWVVS
jgi:hypothetical protein